MRWSGSTWKQAASRRQYAGNQLGVGSPRTKGVRLPSGIVHGEARGLSQLRPGQSNRFLEIAAAPHGLLSPSRSDLRLRRTPRRLLESEGAFAATQNRRGL
jgi:hypothetical protein